MPSRRNRRTQKAGYKYLRNIKREFWVDTLVPYGNQIISQIPKIDWTSFTYTGPVQVKVPPTPNNTFSMNKVTIGSSAPVESITTLEGIATAEKIPYEVFGGAACELWATVFPDPPIRKFVDPTGDIDTFVALPSVKIPSDDTGLFDDPDMILFNETTGLTELGDQYTRWLFNEVVRVFAPLALFFDKPVFQLPNKDEDNETKQADIAEMYGNLLFTRIASADVNNLKIQISTKIVSESVTTIDHLLEFMILKSGMSYSLSPYTIRGIYVADPIQLFRQQVKGLNDRGSVVAEYWRRKPTRAANPNRTPSFYKVDNHCGRLLYLAHLMKHIDGKHWPLDDPKSKLWFQPITPDFLARTMKTLYENKTIPMCRYHFQSFEDQLFSIFETYSRVPPGTFTRANSPIMTLFRQKLYKGGRSRTRKRGGGCGCGYTKLF